MNPYRTLPVLETTKPTSTAESLGHVRGWLEEMTDTNPYTGIDWSTYQIVLQWSSRSCVARSVTRRRALTTGTTDLLLKRCSNNALAPPGRPRTRWLHHPRSITHPNHS